MFTSELSAELGEGKKSVATHFITEEKALEGERQIQSCSQPSLVRRHNSAEQPGIMVLPGALVLPAPCCHRDMPLYSPKLCRHFGADKEVFSLDSPRL